MITEIMKLGDINPAPYNPRKTLKPGDEEYEALKRSIDKFTLVEPLVVNKTTGTLIGGHQRLNVMKDLGMTEAEVVIVEVDEQTEKLMNIALNKVEGETDYEKLEKLFDEITPEDIQFTGYTGEELVALFGEKDFNMDDVEVPGGSDFDDEDEDTEEPKTKDPAEDKPAILKEFNIFLSFATKEAAEKWLADRGVDTVFEGAARNITIRMEGLEYGKDSTGH